ncbi:uncharacterized protein [Drosophila kikkawai]|uniref:Uncharacterized protein n=1 Tax=Drosophila kikkawai TaxID=30033 RepID=A0A6P4HMM2_DROKI|nr:uncharacterized protein LOC108070853 [Drosophila kikkawai]
MLSKKISVNRRLLAFEFGNLVKIRGIAEFQLCNPQNWPGDDLQSRAYERTWFNRHEAPSEEIRGVHNRRLDETMYSPKLWTEREYQSTWREHIMEEEEDDEPSYQEQLAIQNPCEESQAAQIPDTLPRFDSTRRLQKTFIPASEFFSKFISDQQKRRIRHYEAEVIADRLGH